VSIPPAIGLLCAVKQRNLWGAEMALREMQQPSVLPLDYLDLLADMEAGEAPGGRALRPCQQLEQG